MRTRILFSRIVFVFLILILPFKSISQKTWKPYINAGYITNLKKASDSRKADTGGSIRFGVLHKGLFGKGRLGFYTGYLWFNQYHLDNIGYDDKGSVLLAGIDFMLFNKEGMQWYVKAGIGNEKFTSEYPSLTETETSIKPDFGMLINYKHFNTYLGWQPSDPSHLNIGIGLTF